MCDHSYFHSAMARYYKEIKEIVFLIICDNCGETVRVLDREFYDPHIVVTGQI